MKGIATWFARNSVAANLLMLLIVAAGIFTITTVRKEIFPEMATDIISVTVPYPGATPEEVEEGVCVRIEEAIQGLDGVKKITSSAAEGAGTVLVEVLEGFNSRELLDDVKSRVDAIDTFPENIENPVIREVTPRNQVLYVALSGEAPELTLKRLGEQLRDELLTLPNVTVVELTNTRPYEVSIEVSETTLLRHGLTFNDVAEAVRRNSLDLPGGSVKTEGGEILLRTKGQAYVGEDFAGIPLISRVDGSRILLKDVAQVVDGFAETDQAARFNGKPAVLVQVFRVGDQNVLELAAAVKEHVASMRGRMPAGIELTIWQDNSLYLQQRMELLIRNGYNGLLLVFLVLALFLKFRLAIWVSLGIPISFLGAIWLMPVFDVSVNMLSLFAFIVVLGIVVDDAIVVAESIHTEHENGVEGVEGAIRGTHKVLVPVIFAVLTTVAAFTPLMMVPGYTGKFWRVIPLIIIPTLVFSLIESLMVLPSHLSHEKIASGRPRGIFAFWIRFQEFFAKGIMWVARRLYQPTLLMAMRHRYTTVALAVAMLLITAGAVGAGWVKLVFMPNVEADYVVAMVTMPLGTPVSKTEEAVRQIESAALQLREELDGNRSPDEASNFKQMLTSVGEQPFAVIQGKNNGQALASASGAHLGEVNIELATSELRTVSSEHVMRRWRELAGPVAGAVQLTYTASLFSAGDDVNIQLSGPDMRALRAASEELRQRLAQYPGVSSIADSFRSGKEEVKLRIKPQAEQLGLSMSDLARQVRQAFYGEEAQRIQRGRDELKVMVRYPEQERRSLASLEQMRIRTPNGAEVPFSQVADANVGRGFSTITRVDRNRTINVTADVDEAAANANDILTDVTTNVMPGLLARYPGLRYSLEGTQREQQQSVDALGKGFLFSLLVIYALMAIPFKSYIQPVIVLSAVPFGLVGAVAGHLLMGMDLSVLSLCGMVALTGVVVNDSLVLVDFINRKVREEGATVLEAVSNAGVERFRPIMLTSLTTFAGLTPLLLETSVQAQFLIPMAISLAFGVLFATFITLGIVPAGYLILEDMLRIPAVLRGWLRLPASGRKEPAKPEDWAPTPSPRPSPTLDPASEDVAG